MPSSRPLPQAFCWSRFGTEAGESIEAIVARKEHERRANSGVFLWGIGNSVAPGMAELLRRSKRPEVLFSPIKGRPRAVDVSPAAVVRWGAGLDLDGARWPLPAGSCVTSRAKEGRSHYALVCSSRGPLELGDFGRLCFGQLRNIRSDAPIGASQVTAVVNCLPEAAAGGPEYVVALRVRLVSPYFLRLCEPACTNEGSGLLAA